MAHFRQGSSVAAPSSALYAEAMRNAGSSYARRARLALGPFCSFTSSCLVAGALTVLAPAHAAATPSSQEASAQAHRPPALPDDTLDATLIAQAFEQAARLPRLNALIVARHGVIRKERRFRGPGLDAPVNVKSISKSIVSALVGIAIAEGKLEGVQQPIAPFFARYQGQVDPRFARITLGDLLTMRSGLVRTSGEGYMRWVSSRNWVEHVLLAPMIAEPGGSMIYSTGNTHLLSAILTQATGQSTYAYARDKLATPLGIKLPAWQRDPQGIYFGGNQMRLSAHALVRIGELYRSGGMYEGKQVLPAQWVEDTFRPRTRSIFSGQLYGYGWFVTDVSGHDMYYAWGYGGQFIFVIPALALTVVTTSRPDGPRDFEHLQAVYDLLSGPIVQAALAADAT
jgi:CubicO group peptidase (beta-lactamase class C family)